MDRGAPPDARLARLGFVGTPILVDGDGRAWPMTTNDAALLLALALRRCTSRHALAMLGWPDAEPARARNNLRQRLHRLRRRVGMDVVTSDGDDGLRLLLTHDLEAPEAAWLNDAEALPGELLGASAFDADDELGRIVLIARQDWRQRRRRCLQGAAEDDERTEHWDKALRARLRLCREHPLDTQLHAALMRLHSIRGEYAAAAAVPDAILARVGASRAGGLTDELLALQRQARMATRDVAVTRSGATALPLLLLRPPRMVGREAALHAVTAARSSARAALVLGAPGMGKSRLLQEVGVGSVIVKARPGDAAQPLALLARCVRALFAAYPSAAIDDGDRGWLARAVPELGIATSGAENPARNVRALCRLATAAQVSLLALDDLQFADAATLALLPSIGVTSEGPSPTLLMAARQGELPPALEDWRHAGGDGLSVIDLQPLSADDVERLLDELGGPSSGALAGLQQPGLGRALHRHGAGNPLFVLETLRALWDGRAVRDVDLGKPLPLPSRIGDLLAGRVGHLTPEALALGQVAALADDSFDVELAAAVLERHPLALAAAWSELERAEVLAGRRIVHDLIREACLRSVPTVVAQTMHGRIARYLSAQSPPVPADRCAHHWSSAGRWSEAGQAWIDAARAENRRRQRTRELRCWRLAADAFERAGRMDQVLRTRAYALESLLYVERVDAALAEADRLSVEALDDPAPLQVGLVRLQATLLSGRFAQARDMAPPLVAGAKSLGDEVLRLRLLLLQAQAIGQSGDPAGGLSLLQAESADAIGLRDDETEYECVSALAYLLRLNFRRVESAAMLDRGVAAAERMKDPQELLTALASRGRASTGTGPRARQPTRGVHSTCGLNSAKFSHPRSERRRSASARARSPPGTWAKPWPRSGPRTGTLSSTAPRCGAVSLPSLWEASTRCAAATRKRRRS